MKHILFFGDSNTWGYIPGTDRRRFAIEKRLCPQIQNHLGTGFRVIEEGLNGRTTAFDDPLQEDRCGRRQLPMLLDSHAPLDLVAIMLGTNDQKHHLGLRTGDIAQGMGVLADLVLRSSAGSDGSAPKLLIVSPIGISDEKPTAPKFDGAIERSGGLAGGYAELAGRCGAAFFDAANVVAPPVPDGIHLDEAGIQKLSTALAGVMQQILS